ncbi:hypothetical protein MMX123_02766 [Microbacterium sp. MM2322]|uniref:TrlF family AAA-like ATPase n=1 Tax=Microbacterium sp. MM2322 TaxID=3157631 RepID=UPI003D805F73
MKRYEAGSEWRKWDLHVHLPGTKLSDGYKKKDGKVDWPRFADALENSDVNVIGITDYFSAAAIFDFIHFFRARFQNSEKVLLANVELRLNEAVNENGDLVHFHVIFRDDVDEAAVAEFLGALQTQITTAGGKKLNCGNLSTPVQYKTATVSRDDLHQAFVHAFGTKADETDHLIYLAPANNDGIRAMKGNRRKSALADEIDKTAHAFFGNSGNRDYFLQRDRYEDKTHRAPAKPVFSGCDAHNFEDLEAWLGKDVDVNGTRQEVTWIKADPTFAGLQQTLIEPAERVWIQPTRPDEKEPYKVIRSVRFTGSKDFPAKITLNGNLNAIIGSRSSGKSALLAHIAHAIDPAYTISQQVMASHLKESEVGPAAGKTWRSVASTTCEVEWSDSSASSGSVIYVPQNWLYEISDNPAEVTAKIEPALRAKYEPFFREHERLVAAVVSTNNSIGRSVDRWFAQSNKADQVGEEIKRVGEKTAIEKARDDLKAEIDRVRKDYALSEEDLERYQEVIAAIADNTDRIKAIDREETVLDPYVTSSGGDFMATPATVQVSIETTPTQDELPKPLRSAVAGLVQGAAQTLTVELEKAVVAYRTAIERERATLERERTELTTDNQTLIEKHEANKKLDGLVKRHGEQVEALKLIADLEVKRQDLLTEAATAEGRIVSLLHTRSQTISDLAQNFTREVRELDDLIFGLEMEIPPKRVTALSEPFRKNESGTYVTREGDETFVDIAKAQADPHGFLTDVRSGKQRLNAGYDRLHTVKHVLQASPEIRFTAELEDDVIGGFRKSTMTPGKQALFALTLILNEAQDTWPLLIDQPEDDLDSRSIYAAIVPYLQKRKRERQIILVTHNANLVVGADAEEVVVANRHGDDSKNRDRRTFDYLTGSLEHTATTNSQFALERMGIREHTCEILDGGEEAFHKRAEKYKL